MDVQTYGRTDRRTDVRNFSPFYRTSSPVGAAAQKDGFDNNDDLNNNDNDDDDDDGDDIDNHDDDKEDMQ